jgi:predicted nucleic acid-binding protein
VDIKGLPAGASCLVDANIFIYHLADLSHECTDFIDRVARYQVQAFVTTTIIAEVLHRRMMAEALTKKLITPGQPLKKLKANPDVILALVDYISEVGKLLQLPLQVIEPTNSDISASHALRQTFGLFVNDSINLACADRHLLTNIVSHDADFKRVPAVDLWEPTDV